MPRQLRDLIPVPARIIGPRVISHDRSLVAPEIRR
jgi:hypothetical protein